MGIFDRFKGRREAAEEDSQTDASAAAAVSPTLDLTEAPTASAADPTARPLGISAEETTRLYNPYEGLGVALDRRDIKAPFKLPKTPEFVFSEEATVHQRSWSENLTYYTGSSYLMGAILGGGVGAARAISAPVQLAGVGGAPPSQRLRLNQLLNSSGKLGRASGNALGTLGLMFGSFESFLRYANDGRLPDEAGTLGAGAATGAVFRSVRGPRQAAAAAAVGTLAASGLLAARRFVHPGL